MSRSYFAAAAGNPWRTVRAAFVSQVWGGALPTALPTVTTNYTGPRYDVPAQVSRCDRLTAALPRGGTSEMHLMHPVAAPLNRLAILRAGHSIFFYDAAADPGTNMVGMLSALLTAGYHVLGECMPVDGYNSPQPVHTLTPSGTFTPTTHASYQTLEDNGVACLRYFLDGPIVALNHCAANYSFLSVDETGISGGGWATDLHAAVDLRIRRSYPVLGSLPFNLRQPSGPGDAGDWEQVAARPWWSVLTTGGRDHEVAYLLGCLEPGRRRVQVLADGDTVFPAATIHTQIDAYAAWIDARVPAGQHRVLYDTTAGRHRYSPETITAIVADMALAA